MNAAFRRAATLLAASTALSACTAVPSAADPPPLRGTAWVLSSLPEQTLVAGATATARFDDNRVSGSDGCNRYSAPYAASGPSLRIGPQGPRTKMACAPEVMRQADAFMGALERTGAYRVAGGSLQLLAADGRAVAEFVAQPQALAGTSWRVNAYNNGRQAVVSTLAGTSLTMRFGADGRVSGSAGCNQYGATYSFDGARLAIGPAAATRRMCAEPERVMEQEREFLKALETVASARFEAGRLELRTADGALALTLAKDD